MDFLFRSVEARINKYLKPNKAVILLGARRVGKTKLIEKIIENATEKYVYLNGEDVETQNILSKRSTANYQRMMGDAKLLIIDEAQEIKEIGKKIKLMLDTLKGIKVLVSGSSAIELNNNVGEPLVGRKNTIYLYPLAQLEFSKIENSVTTRALLEERLILGSYPELVHLSGTHEKKEYLREMVNSYLLKDILAYEGVRKRDTIISLLKIISYRIGSEVSLENIGRELQISKNTVERYLDLFSQVFIIYKVTGFSRNLDNEITKKNKWYYYDNGIRNAIINHFSMLDSRDDQGQLWENYLFAERKKYLSYTGQDVNEYFWRTHTQQEIDRIEEANGKLAAFEFKWQSHGKIKVPPLYHKGYPASTFEIIDQDNYLDFISPL